MAKQHFVMLAQDYQSGKHRIGGQFASEKLDGIRAIWDGGITRGLMATDVPWCNSAKHDRFLVPLRATGLWSRYGQPIQAPDWWLDLMPRIVLDGELWGGRGMWQALCSAVQKKHNATFEVGGEPVKYMAFDSPCPGDWLADRLIDVPNFKKELKGCIEWFYNQAGPLEHVFRASEPFNVVNKTMQNYLLSFHERSDVPALWHNQVQLPYGALQAEERLSELSADILGQGGEGIIIRQMSSTWKPERTTDLLKMKPEQDAEAIVLGYKWGKKTDKGSKLLGLMGSLICQLPSGKQFELSGFTDAERGMVPVSGSGHHRMMAMAIADEGKEVSDWVHNPKFPRGSQVSFKFREWSDDGLPKEAKFFRSNHEVSAS
jgi:DNA ligase-1